MNSNTGINTLLIPDADPYYYTDSETLRVLQLIHSISTKHPVNVLVAGRQGCGKSSIVRQYAAVYRKPLATFQKDSLESILLSLQIEKGITEKRNLDYIRFTPEAVRQGPVDDN